MGANSVTGVGPGASHGTWKCGNQCGGCGCGCDTPTPTSVPRRGGCYKKLSTGQKTIHKAGGSLGIRVC